MSEISHLEKPEIGTTIKDSFGLFTKAMPYINFIKSGYTKEELPVEQRSQILAAVRHWDTAVSFLSGASITCKKLGLFLESRRLGDEVVDTTMILVYEIWAAQLAENITPEEGVSSFLEASEAGSIYKIVDAFAKRMRKPFDSPVPFEQRMR